MFMMENFKKDFFQNKYVLIGASAQGLIRS